MNQNFLSQEPAARQIVPLVLSHAVRRMVRRHLMLIYQREVRIDLRGEGTYLVL